MNKKYTVHCYYLFVIKDNQNKYFIRRSENIHKFKYCVNLLSVREIILFIHYIII